MRLGCVLRALPTHHRDGVLDIEVVHDVRDSLVEIDGAVVDVLVGGRGIDRADQLPARLIDDPHALTSTST